MIGRTWAVVGGGMMGMTLALRLSQAGHRVVLYEGADTLGGLGAPWTLGDVVWDRYYHVTLLSDSATRSMLAELGLESEVKWVETKTGFLANGQLVSMSNAIEYLLLPGLSPLDKLRIGATIVYGSRVTDWRALERVSVEDWLTRLSGRSAFQTLWRPLLEAKLGAAWREASAAFIWATIQRLYAARRTGLKKEMFGYVPGGYARVTARFQEQLVGRGVEIRLGDPVRAIRGISPPESLLRVETAGTERSFERVVVTATPRTVARLCPDLLPDQRRCFDGVRYQGVVCASLLLEKPLAGYYLSYLTDPGIPFTALIEMTALVDPAEFRSRTLIYLPCYAPASDPLFELTDEEIRARFTASLSRICPPFRNNPILAFRVSRTEEVFPLPVLGYSSRLPPLTTNVPGLTAVSSAHIVNGTLNVNDTLKIAERAAKSLVFSDGRHVFLD